MGLCLSTQESVLVCRLRGVGWGGEEGEGSRTMDGEVCKQLIHLVIETNNTVKQLYSEAFKKLVKTEIDENSKNSNSILSVCWAFRL